MFYILVVLLFPILLPIVLVQAIIVRKQALVLPEAKGERVGSINNTNLAHTEVINFLMLGDSVAAGVGVELMENSLAGCCVNELVNTVRLNSINPSEVNWQIIAKSGKRLHHVVSDIEEYIQNVQHLFKPNFKNDYIKIVISIGVNDVTRWTSKNSWCKQLNNALCLLENYHKNCQITLLAIPDMSAFPLLPFPLNRLLGWRCEQINACSSALINNHPNVDMCDLNLPFERSFFALDGFHPSEKACKLLAFKILS